jgi:hypothetical protein
LPKEAPVGIGQAATQSLGVKALGLNSPADGIRVNAKFSGNGPNLPMLGVEVTTDLGTGFRANHLGSIILTSGFLGTDRRNGPADRKERSRETHDVGFPAGFVMPATPAGRRW